MEQFQDDIQNFQFDLVKCILLMGHLMRFMLLIGSIRINPDPIWTQNKRTAKRERSSSGLDDHILPNSFDIFFIGSHLTKFNQITLWN